MNIPVIFPGLASHLPIFHPLFLMPNMWGESVISGPRARDSGDRERTSIICGRVVKCCKIRSFQTTKSLNIHVTCFFLTCVCSFLFTNAVHNSCAMFLKHTLLGRVMFWSCLAFTFFFKNNLPHYCLARSSVFKKESPGPWEVPKGFCPPPPAILSGCPASRNRSKTKHLSRLGGSRIVASKL